MLNERYVLHDVGDVEAFCAHVAGAFCKRTGTRLPHADRDGLVQYLIVETWKLSEKFQPASPTASFRAYAHGILSRRCIDWMRGAGGSPFKRTRWRWSSGITFERQHVVPLSLDTAGGDGDPLGAALGAVDSDLADVGDPGEFGGLLVGRDGERDWDLALVRATADRLLRERADAAAERKRLAKETVVS